MGAAMRASILVPWVFVWVFSATSSGFAQAVVPPEALYDKSRALIIGIEQYPQGRSVPGAVEDAQAVIAVLGLNDLVAVLFQQQAHGGTHQVFVVDHQDAWFHRDSVRTVRMARCSSSGSYR